MNLRQWFDKQTEEVQRSYLSRHPEKRSYFSFGRRVGWERRISTKKTRVSKKIAIPKQDVSYVSETKIEINKHLVSLLKEAQNDSFIPRVANLLFLESPELNTINTLEDEGIKSNMFIPNCFFYSEVREAIMNKYNSSFLDLGTWINVTDERIGELINNPPVTKFHFTWLDYCCHFLGNKTKKINPKDDIENYFRKKLPADKSIFAITTCRRSRVPLKRPEEEVVPAFIKKTARKHGYEVTHIKTVSYHQMKFFSFWVKKSRRFRWM